MNDRLHLPDILDDYRAAFDKALGTMVRATWPEGETYQEADQPKAIATALIRTPVHERLTGAKIAYLYRQKMEGKGRIKLGTAARASGKIHFLTGMDFVIEFNWEEWRKLPPAARIALVDHELCHCDKDQRDDAWVLVGHDVEEFGAIVRRWGLWKSDLVGFGQDVVAAQADLFATSGGVR